MVHYLHVWVRSDRYRGFEPLTYKSDTALAVGSIVKVPLRDEEVLGLVSSSAPRPKFKTKNVSAVLSLPPLPLQSIQLAEWISKFYASPIGVITSLFLPKKLIERQPAAKGASVTAPQQQLPRLTDEQRSALGQIDQPDTYTLHGRTGSGKTRIYIELTRRSLQAGKSVIVLCPEIGLTSQIADNFTQSFGDSVVMLHSQLTAKERELKWQAVLQSKAPLIVIGPRSALFSPLHDIGLIIVDESHDQAYKQEQPPYYHAVRIASQLRELHHAVLVLGSATPSVADYYVASLRKKPIIRLSQLAKDQLAQREVTIVDLKDRSQFSHSGIISDALWQSINQSLENGEQNLLYLNRRGTARVTLCDNCGWQARCPHCDLPLTYHGDTFHLRCHICGYSQSPPTTCPVCGNSSIAFKSFGTKAIAAEAMRLFPGARVSRFDADNTKTERLEEQYDKILHGDVDILVGTQILAKGLDLPRLSTLGIILADTSLYLPDYTAQERTYQLLTQVIGRIGRGHVASRAIVQTYYPESELLRSALGDQWETFYDAEIAERRQFAYPPFYNLLKLSTHRANSATAERVMKDFKTTLEAAALPIMIDGPAPAFHEKVGNKYQWQLVLKARSRASLIEALKLMPKDWSYDIDPVDLL